MKMRKCVDDVRARLNTEDLRLRFIETSLHAQVQERPGSGTGSIRMFTTAQVKVVMRIVKRFVVKKSLTRKPKP